MGHPRTQIRGADGGRVAGELARDKAGKKTAPRVQGPVQPNIADFGRMRADDLGVLRQGVFVDQVKLKREHAEVDHVLVVDRVFAAVGGFGAVDVGAV